METYLTEIWKRMILLCIALGCYRSLLILAYKTGSMLNQNWTFICFPVLSREGWVGVACTYLSLLTVGLPSGDHRENIVAHLSMFRNNKMISINPCRLTDKMVFPKHYMAGDMGKRPFLAHLVSIFLFSVHRNGTYYFATCKTNHSLNIGV